MPVHEARLSTYFVPTTVNDRRKLETAPSEMGLIVDSDELETTIAALDARLPSITKLAACTSSMIEAGAPLPCRTAGNPTRCFAGLRSCGTAEENTREPFVELDYHEYDAPFDGRAYLFEVKFHLPPQEEYGQLLFHPPSTYGGDVQANRGWRMEVYDEHRTLLPVQCQDWNIGATATEYVEGLRTVEHACLRASADERDYETMTKARIVKIILKGEHRQLWLDSIDVVFRHLLVDGPPPSHADLPPPSPSAPPDPPAAPPTATCTWTSGLAPVDWEAHVVAKEPCHISRDECCAHARERESSHGDAVVAVMNEAACCFLVGTGVDPVSVERLMYGAAAFAVL